VGWQPALSGHQSAGTRTNHPSAGDARTLASGTCAGPIPADALARAVALTIGQPEDGDINEILSCPARREL